MKSGCEVTKSKPDIAKSVFQKPLSGSDITKSKSDLIKSGFQVPLSDSDPFVGDITKKAQPNYGVAFEMTVP
jgi:hypothetical protein